LGIDKLRSLIIGKRVAVKLTGFWRAGLNGTFSIYQSDIVFAEFVYEHKSDLERNFARLVYHFSK
jgi:hypothetical protein